MSFEDSFIEDDEPRGPTPAEQQLDNVALRLLEARQGAYTRCFRAGGASVRDVEIVMDDLARFCRAFASTHHDDPRHSARLDGRREVYLRILEFSRLPQDVLFDYYHRRQT